MSLSLSLWLWKQETVTLDFFLRTVFVQPNKSNWLGQTQWTSTSKRANHGSGQNMQSTWRAGKRLLLCVGDWFSHSANHNTAEDHACQLLYKLDQISKAGGATKRGETRVVFAFLSDWPRIWREILNQSLTTVMQNRSNWAQFRPCTMLWIVARNWKAISLDVIIFGQYLPFWTLPGTAFRK